MAVKVEETEEKGGKGNDKKTSSSLSNEELQKQLDELRALVNKKNEETIAAPPANSNDQTAELFKTLLAQVKKSGDENQTAVGSFQGYTNFDDISTDDMLDPKDYVTFMSPRVQYVIVDAIINNRPVPAPYKPIIFKFNRSRKVISGRETEMFNTSIYVCKSKKELEFLNKHHLREIMFFEKSSGAKLVDNNVAIKMVSVLNSLKSVGSTDLFAMCTQFGITPSDDVAGMRQSIAIHQANKMLEQEKNALDGHNRKSLIEQEMLTK